MSRVARANGQASPTNLSPVLFNVTFSEPVVGVTSALFSTSGSSATVGAISVTALDSLVYRVSVPVSASGSVLLSVTAPAGVTDVAGNALVASGLTASVTFDTAAPRVVRVALAKTQASPTNASPVLFNITMSKPVVGVTSALFNTSGSSATVGGVTVTAAGALVYQVSVPVSSSGSVVLRVSPPSGVADLAGNALQASSLFASASFGALLLVVVRVSACVLPTCACVRGVQTTSLRQPCAWRC